MFSKFQLATKFTKYLITASNGKGHGIHSPFVFEFVTRVLNDRSVYPDYAKVETLRDQLMTNRTVLTVEDFGAGSGFTKTNQRTVSSIAQNAAKSGKLGQLLFRIVKFYKPSVVLELGTSLGITTSYLALAKPDARVISFEGSNEIASVAKNNFRDLEIRNIQLIEGNFDDTLATALTQIASVDLVFIDGNHRKEPTERYFQQLLNKVNNDSILIFDDIHWSSEMEAAWKTIKNGPSVTCTIDLFFVGMAFFRKEFKAKQHFTIRF